MVQMLKQKRINQMLIKINSSLLQPKLLTLFAAALITVLVSSIAFANEDGEENEFIDTTGIDKESATQGGFFGTLFGGKSGQDDSASQDSVGEPEIRIQEQEARGNLVNTAVIRLIDKTLGKLYTLEIPVGTKKTVNEMTVKVNKCWKPEAKTIVPEGRALIEVFETRGKAAERLFNGWIYAQSPSASQLSHHKYDITLGSCTQASVAPPPVEDSAHQTKAEEPKETAQ